MKKILFGLMVITAASCGNNNSSSSEQPTTNTASTEVNTEDISNIDIFKSTDCATCHRRTETFVGPSFTEIATRYTNAADTAINSLAATIINGSSGKWKGTVAAMTPHPSITKSEAADMVKYILQVKK